MWQIRASGIATASFRRKPVFDTYVVAAAENNRNPPRTATENAIQFHATRPFESSAAGSRRSTTPMRRRSTVRLVASHVDTPRKRTHTMTRYIHDDPRTVTPTAVLSHH